ncbi:tRNA-modifying protein ygfZ [Kingella potus]|uniref:tRNA-modifying protein ygfZ n=1 Tax=Kingella potus TaxID=265175 RepID=A0A377QZZ0_9NEIS|nr:folate-binding protein YgfZ [Kingella potus]UOP01564.1 folate-binding protein YgfZ [Kingella potus]STR00148.1 tRNA-modifying protein ygfZ [Kingella potus]
MHTSLLPFFAVIRATGSDRASFLHGQLSNHIEALAPNQACYATYNTPKGRVIANMIVANTGGNLLLVLAADLAEAVVKRLRMFVLRADVGFEILENYGAAGRLDDALPPHPADAPSLAFPFAVVQTSSPQGADGEGLIEIPLPHGGVFLVGASADLPAYGAAAENAWNLHEIRSGYPWICAATKESCVAQMLNQHTIGGVHFKKGCYPGQEIIARAQYRGQVKRGPAVLAGGSVAAGAAVLQDLAEAGIVLNSADSPEGRISLAVIKHGAAQGALTDAAGNTLLQQQIFFHTEAAEE